MTSISNYESVELSDVSPKEKKKLIDFIKNFKFKKPSFAIRKKHIAVASMGLKGGSEA